jgi:hypothetical protein
MTENTMMSPSRSAGAPEKEEEQRNRKVERDRDQEGIGETLPVLKFSTAFESRYRHLMSIHK